MTPVQSTLWRSWDRVSIYLPVILMGVMALGTYWLARNTPTFSTPATHRATTHDPDYFMRGFSVKSFDPSGRLKSEIYGKEARHYPDSDTLEIDEPRIRSFSETGQLTTATARRAISNGDGSEVQLLGNAIVTRAPVDTAGRESEPAMEIRSDFLHVFVQAEQVRTNKPVVLKRGPDEFSGDGLDYNHLDRTLQLHGNVHGTIAPRTQP